jgi:glutaminyl-peptide cyclotransferase
MCFLASHKVCKKRVQVTDSNAPVPELNELEFIRGEIWANVYTTNEIARIDPATGKVCAAIRCRW